MAKNFVLDTNVLLHNPASLFSFADNTVVIPLMVIEELDRFKTGSDKNGMHARQVLREIDGLIKKGALVKGAKMQNGGKMRIAFAPDANKIPELDMSMPDSRIIACALDIQQNGESVFFISKDVNARIRAFAVGLKTQDYEKQKVEYHNLYKGWRQVEVPQEELSNLYNDGQFAPKGVSFQPNEFARVILNDNKEASHTLCKWDYKKEGLRTIEEKYSAFGIKPINMEQQFAFDMLLNPEIELITFLGQAGTGKTLLSLACALEQVVGNKPLYDKVLIARPVIPLGRDIGYLPGSKDQKMSYWMQPIFDNLDFILSREKNVTQSTGKKRPKPLKVEELQQTNVLEIEALTYIRGRSIANQFLIVDEAQNLTPHEIKTIVSRAGDGTKVVLTGDPEQIDNPYLDTNSNGLSYAVERLKKQEIVGHMFFSKSERSRLASMAVENL